MQEITLTIKIQIDGATIHGAHVETSTGDSQATETTELAPFELRVLGAAAVDHRPFMERYIDQASSRGARGVPPSTGSRPYINFMPPLGRLEKRVAALAPSGRLAVFVDPSLAEEFQHAEVVLNSGVPAYVKVYLDSEDALSDGLALTETALSQR